MLTSVLGGAAASSLGGLAPNKLGAFTYGAATGAPVVSAWENFNGANGTNVNGTTTDGGGLTWSAPRCTWTLTGNQARSTASDCPLVVNPALVNSSVEATISRNGSTAWDAGIIFQSNAAATRFLSAEYTAGSNGSLEIWSFNGGWALLGSVTNLYPGGVATAPASIVLRVESPAPVSPATTSTLRFFINGTQVTTVTLSAANQGLYKIAGQTRSGVYTYYDSSSTFDNVHVDQP